MVGGVGPTVVAPNVLIWFPSDFNRLTPLKFRAPNLSSSNLFQIREFGLLTPSQNNLLSMYPKVKVRDQEEEDDQYVYGLGSLSSLKAFDALSLSDLSSPDDSPTSVVRIPRSYISNSSTPATPISTGKTENKSQKTLSESKTRVRASSVPRPRAVLSSPDNDQMIGINNNSRAKLHSGLKSQNVNQSRHTQCKIIPRTIKAESPLNARDFRFSDNSEADLRMKRRLMRGDLKQMTHTRKGHVSARCKALGNSTVAD